MKPEKPQVANSLETAVSESLEGLAFIEFDTVEMRPELPKESNEYYISSIEIFTPFKGKIFLICPEQFMENTIEAITGQELEGNDNPIIVDTLNELLNTICGRFMIDLLPAESEFDFGLPIFENISHEHEIFEISKDAVVMAFCYEDNTVYGVFKCL